ncbi:hypothetical protein BDR03DRAFT_962596 [Suillus americanus]|nr:hypothetical protein BDR03DRAFT_962596 [Suillus americanus]
MRKPFQDCIRGCFSDEEIKHAAAFMHRCLRLDPKDRATARTLLEDPWLFPERGSLAIYPVL